MKSFTVLALLSTALSAFAGVTPAIADGWLSVETRLIDTNTGVNVTLDTHTNPDLAARSTEIKTCYNVGTKIDRAPAISVIDNWCNTRAIGTTVKNGQVLEARYNYGSFTVLVSGAAINGCSFKIDSNCNRLLRIPLDQCNTSGENGKQGGYVTDVCGVWRFDPGSNGSDY